MSIPTFGGIATRGETYTKLLYHIREAQELAAVMGHLHNTENSDVDKVLAKGWLGISQLFGRLATQTTNLAMRKMQ
jgi:hypothetical protein